MLALFGFGLLLTIYADTRATARNSTCRNDNARLLISLGLTRRNMFVAGMIECFFRTAWASILGVIFGAASYAVIFHLGSTGVPGASLDVPVGSFLILITMTVVTGLVIAAIQYFIVLRQNKSRSHLLAP